MATKKKCNETLLALLANLPTEYTTEFVAKYDVSIPDLTDHLTKMNTQLEASANRVTAKQSANASIKDMVADVLESGKTYTPASLMIDHPEIAQKVEMSSNKLGALMRQMQDSGYFTSERVKGHLVFTAI